MRLAEGGSINNMRLARTMGVALLTAVAVIAAYALIRTKTHAPARLSQSHSVISQPSPQKPSVRSLSKLPPRREVKVSIKRGNFPSLRQLCFVRDDYIYLFDPSTGREARIIKGAMPDLSPKGNMIAFTDENSSGNLERRVKIADLSSEQVVEFEPLANLDAFGPRWSNDQRKLAFNVIKNKRVYVNVLDIESGALTDITNTLGPEAGSVYLDSWSADNESILCHSLDYLYAIDLAGKLIWQIPLSNILSHDRLSTATRFSTSPDGKLILFNTTVPDDSGIYIHDRAASTTSRITPETIIATEPRWLLSGKEIMFTRVRDNERPGSADEICMLSLDSREITTFILNASEVSYSY